MEDEQHGRDDLGDELSAERARRETRWQKIREAKSALEAQARQKAADHAAQLAAEGRSPHHVVLVEAVGGPGDGTDVSWLLVTTLPIATVDDVRRISAGDVARGLVAIYFRTWKTGCRVAEMQRETNRRIKHGLAFYAIIAGRVRHLTYLNRVRPTRPGTAVFDDVECKSVWPEVQPPPLPNTPPRLSEFLKLLTQRGGYNHRATKAPAGPEPFWIGLRHMLDFATAWLAFGPERANNVNQ